MSTAAARTRAASKYRKKAYDRFSVVFKKGDRDIYKEYAASRGKSLNGLIVELLKLEMERDMEAQEDAD